MKSIIKLLLRLVQFVCFGISHKLSEVGYWKQMGIDEPCLEWVPCMPGTMVQEYPVLSRNVPLGTGTYYMPEGLSIRPNKNRVSPFPTGYTHGIIAHPAGRQGGRVPIQPSKTPGGLQVDPTGIVVQHMYGHHNT